MGDPNELQKVDLTSERLSSLCDALDAEVNTAIGAILEKQQAAIIGEFGNGCGAVAALTWCLVLKERYRRSRDAAIKGAGIPEPVLDRIEAEFSVGGSKPRRVPRLVRRVRRDGPPRG